ncbi:14196_t:CDS:2, partial [Acaulospora colombiana]
RVFRNRVEPELRDVKTEHEPSVTERKVFILFRSIVGDGDPLDRILITPVKETLRDGWGNHRLGDAEDLTGVNVGAVALDLGVVEHENRRVEPIGRSDRTTRIIVLNDVTERIVIPYRENPESGAATTYPPPNRLPKTVKNKQILTDSRTRLEVSADGVNGFGIDGGELPVPLLKKRTEASAFVVIREADLMGLQSLGLSTPLLETGPGRKYWMREGNGRRTGNKEKSSNSGSRNGSSSSSWFGEWNVQRQKGETAFEDGRGERDTGGFN